MSAQRRIAWTWLAQATYTSPVPFLYQTRTLAAAATPRPHGLRFTSHTSDPHSSTDQHPSQPENEEGQPDTNSLGRDHASHTPRDLEPEVAPRRSYLRRRAAAAAAASSTQRNGPRRSRLPNSPAMTTSEKRVFGQLLEKLQVESRQDDYVEPVKPTTEFKPRETASRSTERDELSHISAIFDSVVQEMKKLKMRGAESEGKPPSSSSSSLDTDRQPETEEEAADMRRKLHRLDFTDEELRKILDAGKLSPAEAVDLIVKREAARIERALLAAVDAGKGESEIWNVCRDRIFSMVQRLGDSTKQPISDESCGLAAEPSLDVPACVPVEAVVTTLYPKMLLVAFRLLNLHFPDSPLISEFRSTIRSLGRESAVLGSSTALYNELIYFYWSGCHDVPGVVSLLREMEVTGIEPDRRTCEALNAIVRQREQDLKQHWHRTRSNQGSGAAREPWWDLPPNRKAVRELLGPDGWIERLEARMKERKERESLYP
ncbi:hypothetical protein ARAM_004158 [Aspergillus rambellii]|uniref:Mtf2-like C-terminal domain-containing protein n=1 Tax=Aspergillus rambellii TaxID=308745 RepID=A0A0F8V175_9EURO|nr:hypothetical protein ARAM_004158 [Aspergillus rambellii]